MLRLVHGHSCENMVDRFNLKMSTIREYTKIIISALAHNIFPKYIHTLSGEQLCKIIKSLETLLGCKTWPGVLMVVTFLCMKNPMKGIHLQ